jgi:hypothetical protein
MKKASEFSGHDRPPERQPAIRTKDEMKNDLGKKNRRVIRFLDRNFSASAQNRGFCNYSTAHFARRGLSQTQRPGPSVG